MPIDSTVKVLAGPGTGKTRLLVARYLKFVFEDGIPPDRLLALTFTKKAAGEMHERIFREVLHTRDEQVLRGLYGAWIINFHQFAHRIIKENAAAFGIEPEVGVATEVELARIRLAQRREFESGRMVGLPADYADDMPSPRDLGRLFDHAMDIVDEGRGMLWTPGKLVEGVNQSDLPEYRRYVEMVAAVWNGYARELKKRKLLDFNDLIRIVVEELGRREQLAKRYASHFEHILVDEFQDTSLAQNELVRILSGGRFDRVTVVGDDKQSIYRWRDARVENLREFDAPAEYLQTNFRSLQGILDLSHEFIIEDTHFKKYADKIRLEADRTGAGEPICVFHPPDEVGKSFEDEAKALGAWVAALTGVTAPAGSPFACYRERCPQLGFGDVAILMRSVKASSGLPYFEQELNQLGIPFSVLGGISALEEQVLELFRNLLQLLIRSDLQSLLVVLEARPFQLPDKALRDMFQAASEHTVDDLLNEKTLAAVDTETARRCVVLRELLEELGGLRGQLDLSAFVVHVMERAQFFYQLFDQGADLRIVESVSKRLFEMVENLLQKNEANLSALLEAIDTLLKKKYFGEEDAPYAPEGRVVIMTIHQAKGLQFKAVALPGIKLFGQGGSKHDFCLVDGEGLYGADVKDWGRGPADTTANDRAKGEREQEERCLLYVGMTRAEDHLYLSSPFPNGHEKGEAQNLFASVMRALPESGVAYEELRQAAGVKLVRKDPAGRPAGDVAGLADLLAEWQEGRERLEEARVVSKPVPQGLQFVTWRGLHTFGACPQQYYYRYVAGVREDLLNGDAHVSAAEPEETFEASPDGRLPRGTTPADFGRFVHDVLFEWIGGGGSGAAGVEEVLARVADKFDLRGEARKEIAAMAMELATAYGEEKTLREGELHEAEWPVRRRVGDIVFQGVVDRVDRTADGYRIIDYKIGAPKEEYNYQLQFYGWALQGIVDGTLSSAVCYLHRPVRLEPVDLMENDLGAIDGAAVELVEATGSGIYHAKPGKVCGPCDYSDICPHAVT